MNDIDELLNLQEENENKEITLYANDQENFESIEEMKEIRNKNDPKLLKIIHSNLINMNNLLGFLFILFN